MSLCLSALDKAKARQWADILDEEEPTSSELDQMQNQEKKFVDEEVEELVDDRRSM